MRHSCLLASVLIILAGCTANKPYRKSLPVPEGLAEAATNRPASLPKIDPATAAAIEPDGEFKIGYVESDDQCCFWGHTQWKAVKEEIANEAANGTNVL